MANTLANDALEYRIFSAAPVIPAEASSIDPSLYSLTPQEESSNWSNITDLVDSGELLATTYDPTTYQAIRSLTRHGRSHSLEEILPPSSGYTLDSIKSINAHGTLLVTAWKDNLLETLLLTPDQDTDGDGLPDAFENANQFNAFVKNNPATDTDNDGLTDLQEFANGTNPRLADTDSDGMQDGWEISWGLNPLDATDANLDPDGDRVTNHRESQINTNPTGIYRTDVIYTDEEYTNSYPSKIFDNGKLILSTYDFSNYETDTGSSLIQRFSLYNKLISYPSVTENNFEVVITQAALPSNRWEYHYDYAWNWLGSKEQRYTFYVDPTTNHINADSYNYDNQNYGDGSYTWSLSQKGSLQPDILTPDPNDTSSPFAAPIIVSIFNSYGTADGNYYEESNSEIDYLEENEILYPSSICISPNGRHRIYATSNGRQIHLNENGELVEVLPNNDGWTHINNDGVLIRYENEYVEETSDTPAHYLPKIIAYRQEYGYMTYDLTATSEDSAILNYPSIIQFSDDQKILLCQYDYANGTSRQLYYLADLATHTLKKVKSPGLGNEYITHLSTTNGRMVGIGSKPWQITPDGTSIRLEALRIQNSLSSAPQTLKSLYPQAINPVHIAPDGTITATTYDSQSHQQIIRITLANDLNTNGLSDDWETSEIQYLITENATLWGYLAEAGTLDATTTYWQDGYTALQSYVLGLSSDWRELSKTTDSDLDGVLDTEDADPLDWAIDWKPAGEATYAVIELDQLNNQGMPSWYESDPYEGFNASIGDTGTILWNDNIREEQSTGPVLWPRRSRVWRAGIWTTDIREAPTTFASIRLTGQYWPDPSNSSAESIPVSGDASPFLPPLYKAFVKPSAVCGESIVGYGSYVKVIRDLPRIVHSTDIDGKDITNTMLDGKKQISSSNVSTIWTKNANNTWQTAPIATPPTLDTIMIPPSMRSDDEWEAVFYRAVASPAGALAVLGGDHSFTSRKWQVWQSSTTPGQGQPLWETPYRTANSQLLIRAVEDDGIVVGERITGTDTFWDTSNTVVIKNGVEKVLPDTLNYLNYASSICQINKNDPDSRSRLAVGGTQLWVEKNDKWHIASRPPFMTNIIAIAKNGVMLGYHNILRNGKYIPLDKLVENQKISPTNPAPRFTNLRAYAMNGEGAIVALADDANAPSPMPNGKTLLLLAPLEIIAHKRGSLNAPGAEVPAGTGEYGYETVMMENGDSESADGSTDSDYKDSVKNANLNNYRKANDDDLVKIVLKWPKGIKPSGSSLKLIHEDMQVDATKGTSATAIKASGPSRLNFYRENGTRITDPNSDLQISDLASPNQTSYISKILADGEVTFFIEGAEKFGDLPAEKIARLGGAQLKCEFTKAANTAEAKLLVYRGGFLRFVQPAGKPGTIGKLEFWDGKGRIRHDWGGKGNEFKKDDTDMGELIDSWGVKSGKKNGKGYSESGKNGHTPPGWWRLSDTAGPLRNGQEDNDIGSGQNRRVTQGYYMRWKQDDEADPAKRYTNPYKYNGALAHDRAIGPPEGIGFKYNMIPITARDPQPTDKEKYENGTGSEVKNIPEAQNRDAIQIHPDGMCNDSYMSGTAGCIGIQTYKDCYDFRDVIQRYNGLKVKVVLDKP